jgi:hypothetical protein
MPRIPLPTDSEKFKNLSELCEELVDIHLLKHPSLSEPGVGFPVSGSNVVEKVTYDKETKGFISTRSSISTALQKMCGNIESGRIRCWQSI